MCTLRQYTQYTLLILFGLIHQTDEILKYFLKNLSTLILQCLFFFFTWFVQLLHDKQNKRGIKQQIYARAWEYITLEYCIFYADYFQQTHLQFMGICVCLLFSFHLIYCVHEQLQQQQYYFYALSYPFFQICFFFHRKSSDGAFIFKYGY